MKLKAFFIAAILLSISFSIPVAAQVKPAAQRIIETHLPAAAPYFANGDPSSQFRLQRRDNDVLDIDAGIVRAKYRISGITIGSAPSPEIAAKNYLEQTRTEFGLSTTLDDLKPVHVLSGSYSTHVTFQQTAFDLPVYGRFVKVNLDASGTPTMVLNGFAPHLLNAGGFNTQPSMAPDAAKSRLESTLNQNQLYTTTPELVVYPSEAPKLAWKIIAWPESPSVELEVLIDAHDGSIIQILSTSTHLHSQEATGNPLAEAVDTFESLISPAAATGSGLVFDPDPLSSSGQFYAIPFIDNNDNDNNELNAELKLVDLLDISVDGDGLYRLTGPHVQIVPESSGGTDIYAPPAEIQLDGFQYTRSDDFFEAVNVYYHIDKSQRYIQSLNVGHDIQNASLRINPHGLSNDNSQYFASQNYIAFGQGGVDDAEDASVIWHEYGHALLQGSAPGLLSSTEGQALHEGWADYWAASYARGLSETSAINRDDWRLLFKWDSGDGAIWPGREVNFVGKYPEDTYCDSGGFQCNIYEDGSLWASSLMDVYGLIGREEMDRLALASHAYLSPPVSFRDAAEAIIQADADLNGSANLDALLQSFNARGLLDVENFGPVASHEEISTTEQLGGTIPIEVIARAVSAPIAHVTLFYAVASGPIETLELTHIAGETYEGQLPLPETLSEIKYYIEVEDELGLTARLPVSNFFQYSFMAGPDNEAPSVTHAQHASVTLVDWPAQIVATVDDNLGVDTVQVSFFIQNPFGNQIADGLFGLTPEGDQFTGGFPVDLEEIEAGSTVFYKIIARDISVAGNETHLPASDYYVFNIIIEGGIFRQYDFESESQGFIATEAWQLAEPAFGLQIAHSGAHAWGINPDAAYPTSAHASTLELPPMNLNGVSESYLVFWHWFDTEHEGNVNPDSPQSTILWDGGNIKVSTDGGENWSVLEPESGYNGTIAPGRENPMGGEPAFGGDSFGWRQVIAPLPGSANVRVRFDFGTDTGNTEASIAYAGWFIDDVSVVTEKPTDSLPPEIRSSYLSHLFEEDPGNLPNVPSLVLFDSTGFASVFVDYEIQGPTLNQADSFRLRMSANRLDSFSGDFPFAETTPLNVGDIISFRFRVSDFAGNELVYPFSSNPPFKIEYRLRDRIRLTENANATGLWEMGDEFWTISPAAEHQEISSLIFGPLDLPANVDKLHLQLDYEHNFGNNNGGNIKLSTDNAATWQVINPIDDYNGFLADVDLVPAGMQGQSAFTGAQTRGPQFDLLEHKGKQIWMRIDFGAKDGLLSSEFWRLTYADLTYSTLEAVDGTFDIPRELALHANYPDPFAGQTTVSYTLAEQSRVRLEIFDTLGRRIMRLVDANQAANTYTITVDASNLSNGLYLLRLETDHGSQTERIIVAR